MAGCPPNRPSSSASTAAVASSSTSGGPSLLRQRVQRRGSQRGAGLAQRGQVVRGGSPAARVAAVVATWLPFVIPLLHGAPPGAVWQGVSDVLLLAGTAWGCGRCAPSAATCR